MDVSLKIFLLDIDKIKIKDRIRKDIGDLSALKQSIKTRGQINPLIIDKSNHLIAGERRYLAMKELGFKKVEVKIVDVESDYERIALEIEENSVRKSFTTEEMAKGVKRRNALTLKSRSRFKYFWYRVRDFFGRLFGRKPRA